MSLRPVLRVVPIALLLLAVASDRRPAVHAVPPAHDVTQRPRLTPAAARAALVALVGRRPEAEHDFLRLPALKRGDAVRFDGDSDGLPDGVWDCRSAARTFVFARQFRGGGLYTCAGVFEPAAAGWRARLVREQRAHPRP